ncbi:MAG: hypothetical protein WD116_02540, partial [Chloroflexota bacterium]
MHAANLLECRLLLGGEVVLPGYTPRPMSARVALDRAPPQPGEATSLEPPGGGQGRRRPPTDGRGELGD